ncbi:MAG: DUF3599 family protein [Hespellia sp.]|nr:DUF3599 family protein [Hespellia sp.]
MGYEELLDHKCAIYHIKTEGKNMGYGIESQTFVYADEPDLKDIPCHFNVGDTGSIEQSEDANEFIVVGKLNLPAGTEVYVNDKIVDLGNGITYTAEIPKNIRNHHMIVNIQRKGKVKGAL